MSRSSESYHSESEEDYSTSEATSEVSDTAGNERASLTSPVSRKEQFESQDALLTSVEIDGRLTGVRTDIDPPKRRVSSKPLLVKTIVEHAKGVTKYSSYVRFRPLSDIDILAEGIPVFRVADSTTVEFIADLNPLTVPVATALELKRVQQELRGQLYQINGQAFGAETPTAQVYECAVQQAVLQSTEGIRNLVVLLGDRDSGCRYTALGTMTQPGVIFQAAVDLFALIASYLNEWDSGRLLCLDVPESDIVQGALKASLLQSAGNRNLMFPKIQFVVRISLLNIGEDGAVYDVLACLANSSTRLTTPYGEVFLEEVERPGWGIVTDCPAAQWAVVTSADEATRLLAKASTYWETNFASFNKLAEARKFSGDLLLRFRVERAVVGLERPNRLRTQGGSYAVLPPVVHIQEIAEGEMCFFLPGSGESASSRGGATPWLQQIFSCLSASPDDILRTISGIAEHSAIVKLLSPYFLKHGRVTLLVTANPSVWSAHVTAQFLEKAVSVTKGSGEVASIRTGWSQYSWYCSEIHDYFRGIIRKLSELDGSSLRDERFYETTMNAVHERMKRVVAAGSAQWKQERGWNMASLITALQEMDFKSNPSNTTQRENPTPYYAVPHHPMPQHEEPQQQNENQTQLINLPTKSEIHPTVARAIVQLQEKYNRLTKNVDGGENVSVERKKKKQSDIQAALKRQLSMPSLPETIPQISSPPLENTDVLTRQLSAPRIMSRPTTSLLDAISQNDNGINTRYSSKQDMKSYPNSSVAERTAHPNFEKLRSRRRRNRDKQVSELDYWHTEPQSAWGLPSEFTATSATSRLPENNPIAHYLEALLDADVEKEVKKRYGQKSKRSASSTSTDTEGRTARKRRSRKRRPKAGRSYNRRAHRKNSRKEKDKFGPGAKDGQQGVQQQDSNKDSAIPMPTISAAGGFRLDRSNGFQGNNLTPYLHPQQQPFGGGGAGAVPVSGGYPYGSYGYTPLGLPAPLVPVKPTLEHHLAPAAIQPYATFQYPEAEIRQQQPIVVHMHHHNKTVKQDGTVSLGVKNHTDENRRLSDDPQSNQTVANHLTPRTTETAQVGVATAAAVKNSADNGLLVPGGPPEKPYFPFKQAPPGVESIKATHAGWLSVDRNVQSIPSQVTVGFEGALNVDPRLLPRRRETSTSSSSSTSKSSSDSSTDSQYRNRRKKQGESSLKAEKRRLVQKILQQLYYYPDAAAGPVERSIQDALPLLQPHEREELLEKIGEYRASLGFPFTQGRPTYSGGLVNGPDRKTGASSVALSHMSSDSTDSLSSLDTDELIERIHEQDLVTRKRLRSVLRGEIGGFENRQAAHKALEERRQLSKLGTKELLRTMKQPVTQTESSPFLPRVQIPPQSPRNRTTSSHDDRDGSSLSSSSSNSNATASIVTEARRATKNLSNEVRALETSLFPKITVSEASSSLARNANSPKSEPSARKLSLSTLAVPTQRDGTHDARFAAISPEKLQLLNVPDRQGSRPGKEEDPVQIQLKARATMDQGTLHHIAGNLGIPLPGSNDTNSLNKPESATGPAAPASPQGGTMPVKEYIDTVELAPKEYHAELIVPESPPKSPKKETVPVTFLPPPKRRMFLPDAGSPLPLSSLFWGGAEGPSTTGPAKLPSGASHFTVVPKGGAKNWKYHPNLRYEMPIGKWEQLGLLAGMEDIPEDALIWRKELRPFLGQPWRKRVMETYSRMLNIVAEKKKLNGTPSDDLSIKKSLYAAGVQQNSQIRRVLGSNNNYSLNPDVETLERDSTADSYYELFGDPFQNTPRDGVENKTPPQTTLVPTVERSVAPAVTPTRDVENKPSSQIEPASTVTPSVGEQNIFSAGIALPSPKKAALPHSKTAPKPADDVVANLIPEPNSANRLDVPPSPTERNSRHALAVVRSVKTDSPQKAVSSEEIVSRGDGAGSAEETNMYFGENERSPIQSERVQSGTPSQTQTALSMSSKDTTLAPSRDGGAPDFTKMQALMKERPSSVTSRCDDESDNEISNSVSACAHVKGPVSRSLPVFLPDFPVFRRIARNRNYRCKNFFVP